MKILILGINGFIGSHLTEALLNAGHEVKGLDLQSDKITDLLSNPKLEFKQGDMLQNAAWIEDAVKHSDVVLPLVAIANPAIYVDDPLRVFELDFEANLAIVRLCVKYNKRVVFPSTSEVYGMCPENEFNEETSSLVLGPTQKSRWIYSCSKQLMDRVIHAYGQRGELNYTLFRPFNWMGPKLDNVMNASAKSSRVVSQFISNIIHGKDIILVNGGKQQRCFTYISDGISGLMKIIENKNNAAEKRVFNLGNPINNFSIAELADLIIQQVKNYPNYKNQVEKVKIITESAGDYYGSGYQDVNRRVPSIKNAEMYLGWKPVVDMTTALQKTLDFYLK